MKTHWQKFKKDPLYLIRYFGTSLLIGIAVVLLQTYLIEDWSSYQSLSIDWRGFLLLPIGLVIGVAIPALMHNCVHGNLRKRILNNIAGELAGIYILLGMAAFELNHRMHHVYADTELDPHNPEGKKFFFFFFANNFGGTKPVLTKYLQFHGDTKKNRARFSLIVLLHFLNVPVRLMFWYLLLGPSFFLTFFVPSYLFHMFVFAHINYYTHETNEEGKSVVFNFDSNLYYRFVNRFGSGVYFHANHHRNPNHYNPMKGASTSWLFR